MQFEAAVARLFAGGMAPITVASRTRPSLMRSPAPGRRSLKSLFNQGPSDFDTRHKFTTAAVWSTKTLALKNALARVVFSDLSVATVFFAVSGQPYSAGVGGSPAGGLRAGIA